jgi:hypothetical protein
MNETRARNWQLLPPPHGFEGLLPIDVERHAHDFPVADGPDLPVVLFDRSAAGLAAPSLVDMRHNRISRVDRLAELDAPFVERADPAAEELSNVRRSAPVRSCRIGKFDRPRLPLHVVVEAFEEDVRVVRSLVEDALDQLHILPRHRLPSISGGGWPCQSAGTKYRPVARQKENRPPKCDDGR